MRNKIRFLVMPLVLVLVFVLSTGVAMAEKKSSPFKELVFKAFGFTKKTVEKEVDTVGKGIKKGGQGNPKWGWDQECYIISLGKILKTEYYDK